MRLRLALASLAAGVAAPALAHADCITIPDGTGNAAVHCSDGTVGQLHQEPGGALTGLLGGQTIVAPSSAVTPPGLGASGQLDPGLFAGALSAPPPSLAPPVPAPPPTPPVGASSPNGPGGKRAAVRPAPGQGG